MNDPFPPEDFDAWAESYDQSTLNIKGFPFTGYDQVLSKVFELANAHPGMSILDLGIGTGNLALPFAELGCEIWGTDFSAAMLAQARIKLPQAQLFHADLRASLPPELNRRFDRIISAYVFHHFELAQKIEIIQKLVREHVAPDGRLLIADIAFPNLAALEAVKHAAGDEWEDEFYWLADETLPTLAAAGLPAAFHLISSCAGIFEITLPAS
ncbi:MAG TPA: hypothetical protein DEH25_11725 [Chloroflexi bacterium]|nr:hypothetical protein [Chloroflexota bacterium]